MVRPGLGDGRGGNVRLEVGKVARGRRLGPFPERGRHSPFADRGVHGGQRLGGSLALYERPEVLRGAGREVRRPLRLRFLDAPACHCGGNDRRREGVIVDARRLHLELADRALNGAAIRLVVQLQHRPQLGQKHVRFRARVGKRPVGQLGKRGVVRERRAGDRKHLAVSFPELALRTHETVLAALDVLRRPLRPLDRCPHRAVALERALDPPGGGSGLAVLPRPSALVVVVDGQVAAQAVGQLGHGGGGVVHPRIAPVMRTRLHHARRHQHDFRGRRAVRRGGGQVHRRAVRLQLVVRHQATTALNRTPAGFPATTGVSWVM